MGFWGMLSANRFTLKEWAVVVKAMTAGRQLVLLRKGGIEDEAGQFRLDHSEFFLYPTFEHQHRKFVRPEFLADFDQAIREQPENEDVIVSGYATVTNCVIVDDVAKLRRLAPFHVWNDEYVQIRFSYKPGLPLYALLLRTFKIPTVQVPFRAEYRGCKSWVELHQELPTAGAAPALTDAEFKCRQRTMMELLGPLGLSSTPIRSVAGIE